MAMTLAGVTEPQPATQGPAVVSGNAPGPTTRGATRDVRFHIFIIDTGWNCAASNVLREHINMISDLNIDDELFVLDRPTSIALLRHYRCRSAVIRSSPCMTCIHTIATG